MLRGISSTGPFGQAKRCVINVFDTNYMLPVDDVMTSSTWHTTWTRTMLRARQLPTRHPLPSLRLSLPAAGHTAVEDTPPRGSRGGRSLPNKCSACGSMDHILSSCTALDDALPRWTIAKRKMIIQKYGAPGALLLRTQLY
jgi:hypothetical protein